MMPSWDRADGWGASDPPATKGSSHSLLRGLWRLADPKICLASLVPFCVGTVLAWRSGAAIDGSLAVLAFAAIFLVEVGKNAANDLYDFRSGADSAVLPEERSPYSGGKRVLVDGLLGERDLVIIVWASFALAAAIGFRVAVTSHPWLLLLGVAAAVISVLYVMPPVHLSYRGLGELAVFAVYGPGIVIGSMFLHGATVTHAAAAASLILGILIANVLLANEIPDERADRLAGKRTLIVRLGRERGTSLIGLLFLVAFLIAAGVAEYEGPLFLAGALAGVPAAALAYRSLRINGSGPPVKAQTATLLTYVMAGAGIACAAAL